MFTIEYVIVRRSKHPRVVERMVSEAVRLVYADRVAKSLLDSVRERRPETPPDGYQILDNEQHVVLRSWQRQS